MCVVHSFSVLPCTSGILLLYDGASEWHRLMPPGAYLRALHRDAWAHWCQLYQSRLMQQGFAVHLIENYFERWKDNVRETDAMKEKADQLVLAREGRMLIRCWDSWVRSVELRSVERDVAERVGARVVSLWYFGKDDCA